MQTRTKRTLGAVSAVAALSLAGGIAAQFTTSTTSAPQQIGTGTVALALDNVAPTVWTDPISNLAAGDSIERFVDLRNAGSLDISGITASQTNTLGDLLTDPSDVAITLQACSVAWNATTGACSGVQTVILGQQSVRAWGAQAKDLASFEKFTASEVRHLKVTTTLAATATNDVQAKAGTITYTFSGAQRTGNAGVAPTPTPAPSGPAAASGLTLDSTSSSMNLSFTDTNDGKATYSVSYAPVEGGTPVTMPIEGDPSIALWGLSPATTYSVTVTATIEGKTTSVSTTKATASPGINYYQSSWTGEGDLPEQATYPSYTGKILLSSLRGDLYTGGATDNGVPDGKFSRFSGGQWTQVASMPTPVTLAGAQTGHDGKFYIIGGFMSFNAATLASEYSNQVQVYSPDTNTWGTAAAMPQKLIDFDSVVGHDGKIYVVNGYGTDGKPVASTYVFDPVANSWSTAVAIPEPSISKTAITGADGNIYVGGGLGESGEVSTMYKLTPSTGAWTKVQSAPQGFSDRSMALGHDGSILVFGGSFASSSDVMSYNAADDTWSTLATMPFSRSNAASVQTSTGWVYLAGGYGDAGGTLEITKLSPGQIAS